MIASYFFCEALIYTSNISFHRATGTNLPSLGGVNGSPLRTERTNLSSGISLTIVFVAQPVPSSIQLVIKIRVVLICRVGSSGV